MTRKIKNKSNYIKWGLLILFVMAVIFFTAYFFGMMLFVEGKIVEDRPLWELACKARPLCDVVSLGGVGCNNVDNLFQKGEYPTDPNQIDLVKWNGYKGCNESTKGYSQSYGGHISGIESCGCESILS